MPRLRTAIKNITEKAKRKVSASYNKKVAASPGWKKTLYDDESAKIGGVGLVERGKRLRSNLVKERRKLIAKDATKVGLWATGITGSYSAGKKSKK